MRDVVLGAPSELSFKAPAMHLDASDADDRSSTHTPRASRRRARRRG
jgi:hypothetical protein